ncbi:hypothetical protein D3C76_1116500 [compost metagenome]
MLGGGLDPDQPHELVSRAVQRPDKRTHDLGKKNERFRRQHGDALRLTNGDRLRRQFTDYNVKIRDDYKRDNERKHTA